MHHPRAKPKSHRTLKWQLDRIWTAEERGMSWERGREGGAAAQKWGSACCSRWIIKASGRFFFIKYPPTKMKKCCWGRQRSCFVIILGAVQRLQQYVLRKNNHEHDYKGAVRLMHSLEPLWGLQTKDTLMVACAGTLMKLLSLLFRKKMKLNIEKFDNYGCTFEKTLCWTHLDDFKLILIWNIIDQDVAWRENCLQVFTQTKKDSSFVE